MEKISFGSDVAGYTYGPAEAPGVVVLQEWWGKTAELEQQAMNLSKRGGYRVLVPDLYRGKVGVDKEEAKHLASDLDWVTAKDVIIDAVDYLRQNGKKVGATGFCQGGTLTFIAAQHARLDAAAPFYGFPQADESKALCQVEKIKVPLLMQFGETDTFFPADIAREIYQKIKDAGGDVELHVYPEVGHAFMTSFTADGIAKMESIDCPRPSNIQEVQDQAWARLLSFFDHHLKN